MTELIRTVLEAHGGLDRWSAFTSASARVRRDGVIWAIKGISESPDNVDVTVNLRKPCTIRTVSQVTGQFTSVTPDRVVVMDSDGIISDELINPRASFAGHALETPWSEAQAAYVLGYALWTCLAMPFILAHPGIQTEEIAPWSNGATTLRRLQATFPNTIPTHSPIQFISIDPRGLLVRHDYTVDIAGGGLAAHFVSEYATVSGIMIPTKRKMFARHPDGRVIPEPVVSSYDLSDIHLL